MVVSFYRSLFHNWSNADSQFLLGTFEYDQWLPQLRDAGPLATDSLGLEVWERLRPGRPVPEACGQPHRGGWLIGGNLPNKESLGSRKKAEGNLQRPPL